MTTTLQAHWQRIMAIRARLHYWAGCALSLAVGLFVEYRDQITAWANAHWGESDARVKYTAIACVVGYAILHHYGRDSTTAAKSTTLATTPTEGQ